jgi:broad specificity polyphosphatase/5'/3'-nucleotidase SurE
MFPAVTSRISPKRQKTQANELISAAPRRMEPVRALSEKTMPNSRTFCWSAPRHREARHDDQEDEEVVDGPRLSVT